MIKKGLKFKEPNSKAAVEGKNVGLSFEGINRGDIEEGTVIKQE